jgi:hypothetical protein
MDYLVQVLEPAIKAILVDFGMVTAESGVLGIKGVHYIGSVQLPLAIWENIKRAEKAPNGYSYRIAGDTPDINWRTVQKNSTR